MKLEAKNIKTWKDHDGGTAYQFTLYVDGKREGIVTEDGWGAGLRMDIPEATIGRLNEYAGTLPPFDPLFDGDEPLPQTAECVLEDIVNDALEQRYIQRLCRRKIVFSLPNEPDKLRTISQKYTSDLGRQLRQRYGEDITVYNETA